MKRIVVLSVLIASLICVGSASAALTPFVYQAGLYYNRGSVTLQNLTLANAPVDKIQPEKGYEIRLISSDNSPISSYIFRFPVEMAALPEECFDSATGDFSEAKCPDISQYENTGESHTVVNIPYEGRAVKLAVFGPDGKNLLERDISSLAEYCGDGKCGDREYPFTCPEDCKSGVRDSLCDGERDGLCDPDCNGDQTADPDCAQTTGVGIPWHFYVILVFAVVLASAAAFIVLRKKGASKPEFYRPM
jgi:hypothetical protein